MVDLKEGSFLELWSAKSSGTLSPGLSLFLDTYQDVNEDAAMSGMAAEKIGGDALREEEAATLSKDMFAALMSKIEAEPAAPDAPSIDAAPSELPDVLKAQVAEALGRDSWKTLKSGIERLTLREDDKDIVEIYKIAPGAQVPHHSHHGYEFSLVVSGGFHDEMGHYDRGDVILLDASDAHQPVGDPGEICYLLTVREGDVQFTGPLGILQKIWNFFQRLFRIDPSPA